MKALRREEGKTEEVLINVKEYSKENIIPTNRRNETNIRTCDLNSNALSLPFDGTPSDEVKGSGPPPPHLQPIANSPV